MATVKADIVPAQEWHATAIANDVRPEDKAELWATSLIQPEKAMLNGLKFSEKAFTGLVNGWPVCMWGVVSEGLIGNVGTPWMVGSRLLDVHARTFLRRCRKPLVEIFRGYDKLENYVDARNVRSIQWLRFMGFTVEDQTVTYGALKMQFHRFWKEA